MEGFRDRADDALRKAAAPTLERIRKDRKMEGLPEQVRRLLAHFEAKLFDRRLNVTSARKELKIGDHSVSTEFGSRLGSTPSQYLRQRRLETAARMLAATRLKERRIARAVGFTSYDTFYKNFKAWAGKPPSEGREDPVPEIDLPTWHRVFRGELTPEEAEQLIDELRRVYPDAAPAPPCRNGDLRPRTVIDGAGYERFQAADLWQRIRALPGDEQRREMQGYLFRSTVFFDLLRTKSREAGRKDREHGIHLAELALASLEGHDEVFGERIHDLRALGWAWLANARRLALDFDGAEAGFISAEREWSVSRAEKDLTIHARIQLLEGGLRMCQRRYPEALERLDESIRLAQLQGNAAVQAEALIQRASVKGYMDKPQASIDDVQSALGLDVKDPYLTFIGTLNLVNLLARVGRAHEAAKTVGSAKALSASFGRLAEFQTHWVEAIVRHALGERKAAEALYSQVWSGFATIGDLPSFALVSLEMSLFCIEENRSVRAVAFARGAVPILQTLKLGREALAAIDLLARELEASRVTELLLRETLQFLSKEPLAQLFQ